MELTAFCRRLPKLELHAHLNGCIRESTLAELTDSVPLLNRSSRTLSECFALFGAIHATSTDLGHVRRITKEVIEDFEKDNVIYVELRTTPKNRPENNVTKGSYMEAVLKGQQDFFDDCPEASIVVRWILSVDRRESEAEAMKTVQLGIQLKSRGVVGIDLSGDPKLGSFDRWLSPMTTAREAGLKLTFHAGELEHDPETRRLVEFRPDRLGHLCFVEEDVRHRVMESRIPLEVCLSSNLVTKSVKTLNTHHVREYYAKGHPVAVCTDDSTVFGTTSSREYLLAARVLELDEDGIVELAEGVIDQAFCDEETKMRLRCLFKAFRKTCEP